MTSMTCFTNITLPAALRASKWSTLDEFLTLPERIRHPLVIISTITPIDFQICLPELNCDFLEDADSLSPLHTTSVVLHVAVTY